MIQVMIVEDEPPIQRGLKSMIESVHDRFKVIAMAFNGQEALELLEKQRPDMIITDIRMPIMDGIELAREVRKRYPEIQIILLSGYQEFEYAREAMQLGITHYLLKPLSKPQLKTTLDDLRKDTLQNKKNRLKQTAASLINGESHADDPFEQDGRYEAHLLMLCCAGSLPIFTVNDDMPGRAFWERYDLQHIASTEAGAFGDLTVLNGQSVSEKWVILSLYKNQVEHRSPEEWAETVTDWLGKDMPISIVYTPYYSDMRQTGILSQAMRSTLYRNMILGVSSWISIHDDGMTSSELTFITDPIFERKLSLSFEPQYIEIFKTEVEKMVNKWKKSPQKQIYVEQSLTRILEGLLQTLHIDHLYITKVPDYVQFIIAHALDYESLSRYLSSIIDTLFSMRNTDTDDEETNDDIVCKIEEYLNEHFAEPIDHRKLSEQFGLVPSYLSKIFSRSKGLSPAKYIVQLRVETAKELLLEHPDLLAKDVAFVVGYSDPNYFSRIFKRETGLYPSEFREKNGVIEQELG